MEAKIIRFERDKHQIWLEPEGLDTDVIYPQGMSTALPAEIQQSLFKEINGLENVQILQYGKFEALIFKMSEFIYFYLKVMALNTIMLIRES